MPSAASTEGAAQRRELGLEPRVDGAALCLDDAAAAGDRRVLADLEALELGEALGELFLSRAQDAEVLGRDPHADTPRAAHRPERLGDDVGHRFTLADLAAEHLFGDEERELEHLALGSGEER